MILYLPIISIFCLIPGTGALSDTDVGVVAAGVISGLILIILVVGVPIIIFYLRKKRKKAEPKGRPPKEHFANGHAPKPAVNGYPKPNPYMPPPQPRPQHRHGPRHPHATDLGSHRGVPIVHITPHGSRAGTPHGSHRGPPHGSVNGQMRGGSARIVFTRGGGRRPPMMFPMGSVGPRGPYPYPMGPRGRGAPPPGYPGPYGYPDPMMHPYFFPPQFTVYVDESDDDESDEDRRSNRSTVRERKMRYHRSFLPDRQSNIVIKEIDSDEEKKIQEEENRKKRGKRRSKSRSRSRSPEQPKRRHKSRSKSPARRRSRTPSPERYRTSDHQDLYTEVSKSSYRRNSSASGGDTAAKIDEMFSFSSDASAKPGDVILLPPGKHIDMSPRRRESSPVWREPSPPPRRDPSPPRRRDPSPPPRRDPSPPPRREQTPPLRRDSTPPRPERKPVSSIPSEYAYASVIRPSEEPIENPSTSHSALGVSMSERLQNIVDSGHTTVIHDLEKYKSDDIQYPPKGQSISRTSKPYMSNRDDYQSSSNRLSSTAKPDLYRTDRYNSDDYRRPSTPPNDIPNETPVPTPRHSLIRRPQTPPNDIPISSRSDRPSTPPFDGDDISRSTSTPAPDRRVPPPPPLPPTQPQSNDSRPMNARNPTNLGNTQHARAAFSTQVLEELKERHRMPETSVDDDDDTDSARNRAVNFSASPPEIIPRSQPNSPRGSQNLNPDDPPQERAPPPPPPPPAPPPLPK